MRSHEPAGSRRSGRRLTRHLPAPAQRVLDLHGEIALGRPAELAYGLGDITDQLGRIAGAARTDRVRHGPSGDARSFSQHLADAVADAAAEIERRVPAVAGEPVDRAQM